MKIDANKKLIAQILAVAGLSFVLAVTTQCGKEKEEQDVVVSVENPNDETGNKGTENEDEIESSFDEVEEEEEKTKDKENSEEEERKEVNIDSAIELQAYFDGDVDFSDVEEAISLNDSLEEKDKKQFLKVVRKLEKKAPTIDLRCLYENCKSLNIVRGEYTDYDIAAVFDRDNHEFHIFKKDADFYQIAQQVLHMTNNLSLELEDQNILLKRDFRNQDNSTFLLEGLNDWLNMYLFRYEKAPSTIQVADVSVIKYMLDLNDDEFIQAFVNENVSSITNLLEEYLTQEEISKFMEIGQKEYNNKVKGKKRPITKKELSRKYSILLKGLLASRNNSISSDEMYQMWMMLAKSYLCYSDIYKEEVSIMNDEFLNTLRNSVDYTENDIVLLDNDDKEIKYCNINQMNMIELKNGNIYIGEEYLDENGDKYYYLGDNAIYQGSDEDIITPVSVLLNQEEDSSGSYTTSDLAKMYFDYMGYNQKEKQAVKK